MTSSGRERVLLYMRTSSDQQARLGTIEAQRQELPAVADRMRLEVVEIVEDDGRSGRRLGTRALKGALDRIEAGTLLVDGILCAAADRLVRADPDDLDSLRDAARVQFVLRQHHIDVIEASGERITYDGDTLTPDILRAVASHEWQTMRRRTTAGKKAAALAGRPTMRPLPYGLDFDRGERRSEGEWRIVEDQAGTVRLIFVRYEGGMGTPSIAALLNAEGVPAPRGGRWHPGTVDRILQNPAYIGRWKQTVGDEVFETPVPAIVGEDTWLRVQAIRENRGNRRPPTRKVRTLLSGVARCGHCGAAVVSTSVKTAKRGRRARYVCCSKDRRYAHGDPPCGLGSFYAEPVDAEVWSRIAALLADPSALVIAANLRSEAEAGNEAEDELEHLNKLIGKADKEVQEILRLWRRSKLNEEQRDDAIDATNSERAALVRTRDLVAARLEDSRKAKAVADSLEVTAELLSQRALSANFEQRAEIIKALCPTSEFGFVVSRAGSKTIDVTGRVCLEVAEGQVAIDLVG